MLIFHVAEKPRWEAAKLAGSYAHSTVGRTLEQEGFIHASREEQVAGVVERYYSDVRTPLVLLTIDTDLLTSPWREEQVGDDTFPHIHGPLNPSSVVAEGPVPGRQPTAPPRSLMSEFLAEFAFRIGAAVFVMVIALVAGFAGIGLWGDKAGLWCLLGGAAVAIGLCIPVARARERRRTAGA